MARHTPIVLGCVTVGIVAGFVSCASGGKTIAPAPTNAAIADEQPQDKTNAEAIPTETRRGDAENFYLEQAIAQCQTQADYNFDARVFEFWDEARENMTKDGKTAEEHLYLKLDALFVAARAETRGKTFGGDAASQQITRPLANDLMAWFKALEYTQSSKTPPSPQVQFGDCLNNVDALLNEVLK